MATWDTASRLAVRVEAARPKVSARRADGGAHSQNISNNRAR